MKILVADSFEKSGLEGLQAAGCEVVYQPDVKDDSLTEAVRATAADVLVVRSTKVKREVASHLSSVVGLRRDPQRSNGTPSRKVPGERAVRNAGTSPVELVELELK